MPITITPVHHTQEGTGNEKYRVWRDNLHIGTIVQYEDQLGFKPSEWSQQHYGWLLSTGNLLDITAHMLRLQKQLNQEKELQV